MDECWLPKVSYFNFLEEIVQNEYNFFFKCLVEFLLSPLPLSPHPHPGLHRPLRSSYFKGDLLRFNGNIPVGMKGSLLFHSSTYKQSTCKHKQGTSSTLAPHLQGLFRFTPSIERNTKCLLWWDAGIR